jgi:hypothetical protein
MNILRTLYLLGALVAVAIPTSPQAAEQAITMPSEQALDALQQLLSAYAAGNQQQLESMIEPQMIGYSRVVDAVRDAGVSQKQLRMTLSDTRTLISEDVVIIQSHWEKRFVSAHGRAAGHRSGTCTFVMRPDAAVWRLSALSGDNPFGADQADASR